jgi:hypothetical protein
MEDLAIDDILNGYQSLLNIRAPLDRTKYPYNQLIVANVKFTQNNIEIIARKIDDQKGLGEPDKNKKKMGGDYSVEKTLVYG